MRICDLARTSSCTLPYALLALAILQHNVFAVPHPWPILIDGLAEVAADHDWLKPHGRRGIGGSLVKGGLDKLGDKKKDDKSTPKSDSSAAPPSKGSSDSGSGKSGSNKGSKGGFPTLPFGLIPGFSLGLLVLIIVIVAVLAGLCTRKREDQEEQDPQEAAP